MPKMEITKTLYVINREEWRRWLEEHHATEKEIWLLYASTQSGQPRIPYVHAVEEAICFGWIDGIAKKYDELYTAQRFTPRRPKGNWTELNKERARRLIAAGKMTKAGEATLPDLSLDAFRIAPDILQALQTDPELWENFQNFPSLYQRIRVSTIEEVRRQPEEFRRRLEKFLTMTKQNKTFGGSME
jgi:uncharacterized protein YdeI (YjbR/CyaY-like superfamily)